MSALPSIGQWVWGKALNSCKVISIGTNHDMGQTILKVMCPQGYRVNPLELVKGIALIKPELSTTSKRPEVGDRVKLKNTHLF